MRYRIDGDTMVKNAGFGDFVTPVPSPIAASASVGPAWGVGALSSFMAAAPPPDGALGQAAAPQPQCGENPRWMKSAFNPKQLWCMCGSGKDYGRCPGCCGPCPACPPRKCQQQPYKVFSSAAHPAFDCGCGPCAPGQAG